MTYTGSVGWTLSTIRNKVRNLTATSANALDDFKVNDYINNYYVYSMPFELKQQVQIKFINFTTIAGVDRYHFAEEGPFLTNAPDAYADGLKMNYYQDPNIFFQDFPMLYTVENPFTGAGASVYTSAVNGPPIIIGSLIVADQDGLQAAVDNGLGQFVQTVLGVAQPAQGSIDYTTGAFTVNFFSAVATGTQMIAKYQTFVATRPQGILFFDQEFTLRPIPDQMYAIKLEGFINPTQITDEAGTPTFTEWGQCLAYGAAFDIFMDRGDQVAAENIWNILKRFETVALGRTLQQYLNERSRPRF